MHTQFRWCSECQDDQVFDVAHCEDGPGSELACTLCGLGVFDSVLVAIAEVLDGPQPGLARSA